MRFFEVFFSIDKIYIPALISFLMGGGLILASIFLKLKITDVDLIMILSVSFVIGNIIKTNIILEKEDRKYKGK